ncbi:hypothetical protein Aduo_019035 [Ancylostoma duodenale]
MLSDLLLAHYDPRQEIVVAADAFNYGIGAVIPHRYPDESEKAIAHASHSLLPVEKNYSQIEREGLALIYAIQKIHKMLHGRKFTLLTDHKPLLAIFGSKKGIPAYTENRLQKWATILLGYDFSIQYRSTTSIGKVDSLFRLIAPQPTTDEDQVSQLYQWMRTSSTYSSIQYEPYQSRLMKTKRQQPTIASSN